MLAIFAGLLKIPVTEEECNDSKSGSELFAKANVPLYRDYIMPQNDSDQIAIRKDNWKYIPASPNRSAELYDLEKEPSESHDMMLACLRQAEN